MSKIGKQPIAIPQEVTANIAGSQIHVAGPKGELKFKFHPKISIQIENNTIKVSRKSENKLVRSFHGLTRSLIANMVKGVTVGHQKILEITGVGYRAEKLGDQLVLNLGYSHPVIIKEIPGVQIETKENKIVVSGADKSQVGEMAARIRRARPPEPYKGKGIKYIDEIIRRKPGKSVKTQP